MSSLFRRRYLPLAAILAFVLQAGFGREDPAATPASSQPTTADDASAGLFAFRFHPRPDEPLYFIIENEVRDSGGVPGWLSYTTTVKDRRVVIQRVERATTPKSTAEIPGQLILAWEVDRYEVREQGMKGEVSFDSVRDLYPPPSLRGLGGIPGSRTLFSFDPRTGEAANFQIVPGPVGGPATNVKLSRTAGRVSLTNRALADLLRDLGPLYLPPRAVGIGDTWTYSYSEQLEPFGLVTTSVTSTLRSVRTTGEHQIAVIDIRGEIALGPAAASPPSSTSTPVATSETSPKPATQPSRPSTNPASGEADPPSTPKPCSQPATSSAPATTAPSRPHSAPNQKQREFVLERTICLGSVEFDLTAGELLSLSLNRELDGAARLEQTKPDANLPSEIRAGTAHILRVRVSHDLPPKPLIVGGPKPPVLSPNEEARLKPPTPATRPAVSTRPARNTTLPTTRPATQPKSPTTYPTRLPPPVGRTGARSPAGPPPQATTRPTRPTTRLWRPPGQSTTSAPTSRPSDEAGSRRTDQS